MPQAVEHGAAVLVVDDRYVIGSRSGPVILTEHMKVDVHELIRDRNICVVTVRDTRKALSALSAAFFDHPAERMKMIGKMCIRDREYIGACKIFHRTGKLL